ncbi:thrombospondin type 1 domain containing lonely heart isoform X2 [Rhynchophorus ferrugineus]|uniref:thrombospondin type 1 domain containing lonely heart isoform X2 n=1 Tax=Rhynchophorus ferrugineus TaxID=354439 RepID=UPI003FCE4CA8
MHLGRIIVRTATVLAVLLSTYVAQTSDSHPVKKDKRLGRYPAKVYDLYQNQIEKKPKLLGEWSSWSPWSSCSRSCGGGVSQQVRHCISRPADTRFMKSRRRRQYALLSTGCIGLYKRIHLCNTQDCPGDRDFRYEQCAAFNNRPFKGKLFNWEPFYQAQTECILNCRPRGQNFYATLNKTVIDGTPCNHPMTATGKAAPRGTRGVCIEGYCKSVNSQGIVGGSDDNQPEICQLCVRGACKGINGIYTRPELPKGYSLIVQIPSGACGLHIQQLKQTENIIALKLSNGTYILNGDWRFSPSRSFEVAGIRITYTSQDSSSLETITSPGPLPVPVDIMIVGKQLNPGIKYSYSIPIDDKLPIAPHLLRRPTPYQPSSVDTRRLDSKSPNVIYSNQLDEPKSTTNYPSLRRTRIRRKYLHWKVTGLTPCTKSCGGGTQNYIRACYRILNSTNQMQVNEKRCAHLDARALAPIACNIEPCSTASWNGFWGQCSVSCGEGVQQFIPQCKTKVNEKLVVVSDAQCPKPKPSLQSRACQERECDYFKGITNNELPQSLDPPTLKPKEWTLGSWSQCSASCGRAHRTRSVTCPSGRCSPENRPPHVEYCDQEPCDNNIDGIQSQSKVSILPSYVDYHADYDNPWLKSEWSRCSEQCGTGNQTRYVLCDTDNCKPESKPETERACSSDKKCNAQWFAGPWGECSDSCNGPARRKREVLCIAKLNGMSHITTDMVCSIGLKPYEEEACPGSCPPRWFTGEWGRCQGNCPTGVQKREVKCLYIDKAPSSACPENEIPPSKRPCTCENYRETRDKFTFNLAQDQPADRSCVDSLSHCKIAVQARLCNYSHYTMKCCKSCRGS